MKSQVIVNIKKLISVLISAMIISSTLPANLLSYVVFADNQTITVSSFADLQSAFSNAQNGDTIVLGEDITIPDNDALNGTY